MVVVKRLALELFRFFLMLLPLSVSGSVSESVSKIPGSILHDFASEFDSDFDPDTDTDSDPDDKRWHGSLSGQRHYFRLDCGHSPP